MHFLFKIFGDLFGNLALTLSAQLSFQNVYEFGLSILSAVSSHPVTLIGLPKDTLSDLVRTLLHTVNRDFQSCPCPENFLVREPSAVDPDTGAQKVILIGASNLGQCRDRLRTLGIVVVDLTTPGWIATPDNVSALTEKLKNIPCGTNDRIVMDLYGNLSYRFEQFDGTLSLPYKSGGKYHLAGDVVACPLAVFKKILDSTTNLFLEKRHCPLVIIPPPAKIFVWRVLHTG